MSINSFDKDNLKNIRVDINTALKAVGLQTFGNCYRFIGAVWVDLGQ